MDGLTLGSPRCQNAVPGNASKKRTAVSSPTMGMRVWTTKRQIFLAARLEHAGTQRRRGSLSTTRSLVGGIPTPLKNMSQLG